MPSNLPNNQSINASSVESQVRLVKGPKPLIKSKFYLDIKSHVITTKLEERIKELGGAIELFLVQEINLVVTDKQSVREKEINTKGISHIHETTSNTPSPSNGSPAIASESSSHLNKLKRRQSASRTDAMLARVRLQTDNSSTVNILHNAGILGIPVWSVDKFLRWLDKISATLLKSKDLSRKIKSSVHVKNLKTPFIKFEPHSRDARPVCYELADWPMINLNCKVGASPFMLSDEKPTEMNHSDRYKKKMIRKTRISLRGVKVGEQSPPVQEQSGYCEICRTDYQDMTKHIQTQTHVNFAKDDSNYLTLDSLITTGANVEAFLRLHEPSTKNINTNNYAAVFNRRSVRKTNSKNKIEIKINGDATLLPPKKVTNNLHTSRTTRSSSACDKINSTISSGSLSPALSDSGHHLRSRGQLCLPSNLLGTTAEDDGYPVKSLKEVKMKTEDDSDDEQPLSKHIKKNNVSSKVQKNGSLTKKKTNSKTLMSRNKRANADDRLIFENRAYYKVEVLSSKLRSSTTPMCKDPSQFRVQTSVVEENGTSTCHKEESTNDRLVVKFKRVRKSELSVLSNEAENFMFPRKDSLSSDNDDFETDDERNTTVNTSSQAESIEIKSSEPENSQQNKQEITYAENKLDDEEYIDENSQDCSSSVLSSCESLNSLNADSKRKKRRRTHAEVFIQDNENYYKFETPGSRLRFQGSFLPLMTGSHGIPTPLSKTVESAENDKTEIKQEIDSINMNNDNATGNGTTENEDFKSLDASNLSALDRVTYSFERIFENDTSDHRKYRTMQIEKDFELFYDMRCPRFIPATLPYETNSPLPLKDPHACKMIFYQRLKLYDDKKNQTNSEEPNCSKNNSVTSTMATDEISNSSSRQSIDQKEFVGRRRKHRRFINSERNPRKSPRQHASTLAILSGLLHQRRRKTKSSSGLESDLDCISLATIPEQNENSILSANQSEADVQNEVKTNFDIDLENLECGADIEEFDFIKYENSMNNEPVDFNDEFNLLNILNTYSDSTALETGMKEKSHRNSTLIRLNGNNSLFPIKEFRRKGRRKKNRTGWPSKRRVLKGRNEPEVPAEEDENDSDMCGSVKDTSETTSIVRDSESCDGRSRPQKHLKSVSVKHFRNKRIPNSRRNKVFIRHARTSNVSVSDVVIMPNSDDSNQTEHLNIENKENTSQAGPGPSLLCDNMDSSSNDATKQNASQTSDCLGFTPEECAEVKKWSESVDSIINANIADDKKSSIEFQPYVKVQKLDHIEPLTRKEKNRRLRNSSSPSSSRQPKSKRQKISGTRTFSPPPSPRKLRKPRGRWYRDR